MKYITLLLLVLLIGAQHVQAQENAKTLLKKAWTQVDDGDYDAATETCKQLLFMDPDDPKHILLRGVLNVHYQNLKAGLEDLNFVIHSGSRDSRAYLYRGLVLESAKMHSQADDDMNKAIALDSKNPACYRMRGALSSMRGNMDLALKDFEQALKLAPDDYHNHYSLGLALFENGDLERAYKELLATEKLSGQKWYKLELKLGECAGSQGNIAASEKHFRQAMDADSAASRPWCGLGQLREAEEKFEEAKSCFLKAMALDPKEPQAYSGMARYHIQLGDDARAVAYLDSAISFEDIPYFYFERGKALNRLGQFEPALADFNHLIAELPQTEGAYFWRGRTYMLMERLKEAKADFNRCIRTDPEWDEPLLFLARTEVLAGENEQARAHISKYTKKFPDDSRGWFLFGNLEHSTGRFREAIPLFAICLATHNPDSVWVYAHRSDCYQQLGDSVAASKDLDSIIMIPDKAAAELTTLGYALDLASRYPEAISVSDQALALDSTIAYAYNNRGFAKLKLGRYEEAIVDFNKSTALPNDYFHWPTRNRGNAKRALGRYQEAIADFDLSINFQKDYAEAYNDRGETWELLGDKQKAIADFQAAVEHKPDFEIAKANLARLQK